MGGIMTGPEQCADNMAAGCDYTSLGRAAVQSQWLAHLRAETGLSATHLAEQLGVSLPTFRSWEQGGGRWGPKPDGAERLGLFYVEALYVLGQLHAMDITWPDLIRTSDARVPLQAALDKGLAPTFVDAGVLGAFITKSSIGLTP